jgi:outer membrane protein assembly factor BamB
MKITITTALILFAYFNPCFSQLSDNWRGPERDGKYPENNLSKEWPEKSPEIKWVFSGLGTGYSSPVVANDRLYVSGLEQGRGIIHILTLDGKPENKVDYGPGWQGEFPGTRVSPAVVGEIMYIASGNGLLSAMDSKTGAVKWQKDLFGELGGVNIRWGYTENLLVDGDKIYCFPGGKEHNVVALNRHTGEIIWSSRGMGDASAYCSPLLFEHNGRKMLATHSAKNILGLDAITGQLLWHYPHVNSWDVHPNTPIYSDGGIFFFSGYGQGSVKLNIGSDGSSVTKAWENKAFDNQMGGAVLHEGHIYGSGHNNRFWFCVNWDSGETLWRSRDLAQGPVVMADGMLYIYSERGELGLVEPSTEGFTVKSKSAVTHGSDQHWAHPVIHNGVMYIRHGNALVAYNVK